MQHSPYTKFYQRIQFLSLAATPVTGNPVHSLEHAWHTLSPAPAAPLPTTSLPLRLPPLPALQWEPLQASW